MRSRISLFILIGLFLFIIDYRFSYDEDLNQIIIPDDEILGLIDTWRDQVGRDPSDEEIVRIINNLVNEEILYREALKLELDKNDRIIKRRLAQKVEFLKQEDTQPSTADLEKFYDENKSKYVVEDLFTFSHHFFSDQDNSEIIARESLVKILNGEAVDSDPFILGNDLNLMSKNDLEKYLVTLSMKNKIKCVILRYFNVAGADSKKRSGLLTKNSNNLIKVVCEVATEKRKKLLINGKDYDTKDGTPIRDFIHVSDLVDMHLIASEYLNKNEKSDIFNCGYGNGYSVKEVVKEMEKILKHDLNHEFGPRREGDIPYSVADSNKFKSKFNWMPKYNNLNQILHSALEWEKII